MKKKVINPVDLPPPKPTPKENYFAETRRQMAKESRARKRKESFKAGFGDGYHFAIGFLRESPFYWLGAFLGFVVGVIWFSARVLGIFGWLLLLSYWIWKVGRAYGL